DGPPLAELVGQGQPVRQDEGAADLALHGRAEDVNRLAQPGGPVRPVHVEQDLGDQFQGELVHLLDHVKRRPGRPAPNAAARDLDERPGKAVEVAGVEGRLDHRPVPAPDFALRGVDALALEPGQHTHLPAQLPEALRPGDEDLADQPGVVHEVDADPPHSDQNDVAVGPDQVRGEGQGRLEEAQVGRDPEEPVSGAGGIVLPHSLPPLRLSWKGVGFIFQETNPTPFQFRFPCSPGSPPSASRWSQWYCPARKGHGLVSATTEWRSIAYIAWTLYRSPVAAPAGRLA